MREAAPRISVDFHSADIRSVLLAFSEFSGVSIIASQNVSGRITARILDQPWDIALYSLLENNGLAVREANGILNVDTIENIRQAEKVEDLVSEIFHLNFHKSVELAPTLATLLSERGKLNPDEGSNSVMVIDIPDRLEKIRQVITDLDRETRQVEISVQLSFINHRALRELGINWQATNVNNPLTDTRFKAQVKGADNLGTDPYSSFAIGTVRRGVNLSVMINALEDMNKAHTVAKPVITTLNNLPAKVLVGRRTPLRVVDYGTAGTEQTGARATTQMVETGVKLEVTPQITENDKILVQIHAENSDADTGPDGVFFNTQEASTRLLLGDGETGVIAGLTVNTDTQVKNGLPGVSKVPLLGRLFSYEKQQKQQEELIIIISTRIIRPGENPQGALPDSLPAAPGGALK
ncbi:hypothetical protein LLH00_06985 [bacterium]|nr:hypothetical protein [bacterium]